MENFDKDRAEIAEASKETQIRFQDQVGNIFMGAKYCFHSLETNPDNEQLKASIRKSQVDFFKKLDEFINAGYEPEGEINSHNLKELTKKYKNVDWCDAQIMHDLDREISRLYRKNIADNLD